MRDKSLEHILKKDEDCIISDIQNQEIANNLILRNIHTIFSHCFVRRYYRACKKLIEIGANINEKDVNGEFPLIFAIRHEDEEMCIFLLENGANPNQIDDNGHSPLILAAARGKIKICEMLINSGAYINYKNKKYNQRITAYNIAFFKKNSQLVKLFLRVGCEFVRHIEKYFIDEETDRLILKCSRIDSEISKIRTIENFISFLKEHKYDDFSANRLICKLIGDGHYPHFMKFSNKNIWSEEFYNRALIFKKWIKNNGHHHPFYSLLSTGELRDADCFCYFVDYLRELAVGKFFKPVESFFPLLLYRKNIPKEIAFKVFNQLEGTAIQFHLHLMQNGIEKTALNP